MYFLSKCVFLFFFTQVLSIRHLPSSFPRCFRNDPKLSECILKATDTVRPLIIPGIPSLDIPPLEPFYIKKLTLEQGTSALNFKAVLTDIRMHGLSKYKFTKFDIDMKTLHYNCELYIPGLKLDGHYKVDGQILVMPLHGNGKFDASVSRVDVKFFQNGKRVIKDGHSFVIPVSTNSTVNVSDPKINLEGLFGNDGNLAKLTTQAINENINVLYEDMRPVLEKTITNFVHKVITTVSGDIPEDELYPPGSKS